MIRSSSGIPPSKRKALSPPPMRRDCPPASSRPTTVTPRPLLRGSPCGPAVDRPGCEIETRRGVDFAGQRIEPRGTQHRHRIEPDIFELLHQIAKDGALGAPRGQSLLLQLVLEIGLAIGTDNNGFEFFVVI